MKIKLMENFRAIFYAPYYAIHTLGFYKSEGIDVELTTSDAPGDAVAHCGRSTEDGVNLVCLPLFQLCSIGFLK